MSRRRPWSWSSRSGARHEPAGRAAAAHALSSRARDPPEVPFTRLTVIIAERSELQDAARQLQHAAGDPEAAEAAIAAGLRAVNAVLRGHRVATHDPYGHEIGREATLVARVGYGTGEGLAEGRWEEAVEIPYPERRRRRAEALRPQERLAAVLAGRERIDICETLLLRARADLDQGRPREAALQLRAGLEALLAELPAQGAEGDQARDLADSAGAPGEHRPGGPGGACGRAVRQARRRRRRDARHLRASPAPPPDPGGARVRAGYPRAASTELRASATSPSRRTEAAESYGVVLLGHDRHPPAVVEGELWQAGDRVDLERGADAEQEARRRRTVAPPPRSHRAARALRTEPRRASPCPRSRHRSRRRPGRTATRPAPAGSWRRSSCSSRRRSIRAPRSPARNPPCDAGDRCSG